MTFSLKLVLHFQAFSPSIMTAGLTADQTVLAVLVTVFWQVVSLDYGRLNQTVLKLVYVMLMRTGLLV